MGLLILGVISCQTSKKSGRVDLEEDSGPIFKIRVRHISDHKAYEDHRVRLGETFFIADTEYSAKVERFIPDFAMNQKTKEVISRSDELLNPALMLEISYQDRFVYRSWILYQNLLPHSIRDPGYYFQFISHENIDDPEIGSESPSDDRN